MVDTELEPRSSKGGEDGRTGPDRAGNTKCVLQDRTGCTGWRPDTGLGGPGMPACGLELLLEPKPACLPTCLPTQPTAQRGLA